MSEWLYLALYRLLFVVHVLLAGYVAGASMWLTVHGAAGWWRRGPASEVAATLRDWLPFMLGLAITFGVGPLLFVQLIDGHGFYTANLLLSHRFMALLPALIVGFYLLYLQKVEWSWVRSRCGRFFLPAVALACFGFTAWSWSENHLLAQHPPAWPSVYAGGSGFYRHVDLPWRLLVFAGMALQSTVGFCAAQLGGRFPRELGAVGVIGAIALGTGLSLHPTVSGVSLVSVDGAVIAAAEAALLAVWFFDRFPNRVRVLAAMVALLALAERLAAVREAVRAQRVTAAASKIAGASSQGFALFVASLLLVALASGWSIWRVRRELASGSR